MGVTARGEVLCLMSDNQVDQLDIVQFEGNVESQKTIQDLINARMSEPLESIALDQAQSFVANPFVEGEESDDDVHEQEQAPVEED